MRRSRTRRGHGPPGAGRGRGKRQPRNRGGADRRRLCGGLGSQLMLSLRQARLHEGREIAARKQNIRECLRRARPPGRCRDRRSGSCAKDRPASAHQVENHAGRGLAPVRCPAIGRRRFPPGDMGSSARRRCARRVAQAARACAACNASTSASLNRPRATPDWLEMRNTKYPAWLRRRMAAAPRRSSAADRA